MILLLGKSASGKTALLDSIRKKGFNKVVTFSTRPLRKGEEDGVDYHFITKDKFLDLIISGELFEYRTYGTTGGLWYYGSTKDCYEDNLSKVCILTPDGLEKVRKAGIENVVSFYIDADRETRLERALNRGDNKKEVERRFETDDFDFINIRTDFTIPNNGNLSLDTLADMIVDLYMKELENRRLAYTE